MNQKKWRIRECICRQLGQLLEIYQPAVVFEYLVPLLLKFCSDNVQLIREEAADKVADFIEKLKGEEGLMVGLVESVKAFGSSPKYTQRQSYLHSYVVSSSCATNSWTSPNSLRRTSLTLWWDWPTTRSLTCG